MYIKFENGTQFEAVAITGQADKVGGIRRDVISATISATYAEAAAAFGQPWALHNTETGADGKPLEAVYDKSDYTVVASICDNCDGTVTVRVARSATREETLAVELAAEQARAAELEADKAALEDDNSTLAADKAALESNNAALAAELQDKDNQIDDLVVEMLEGGTNDVSETETTV